MAVDFDKSLVPSLSRSSEYVIDPREVIIKAELNGRHDDPGVGDLVKSFMDLGQLQPCLIGRDGGAAVLYAGHRRWRAAMEITKKKLLPVTKDNPDQVFKLRCVYFKGDERTAFLATVAENRDRKSTTDIDDAHNVTRMMRWNMSEDEIAGVYNKDVAWVRKTASLVDLTPEAEKALRDGRMKAPMAAVLAKLSKQAQRDIVKSHEGKITAADIKGSSVAKPKKVTAVDLIQDYLDGGSLLDLDVKGKEQAAVFAAFQAVLGYGKTERKDGVAA